MIKKVFCVDDDPITLMLCKKVIEKVEFAQEIDVAQNGEEALLYFDNLIEVFKNNTNTIYPELIFLDLNMPIMNGWEFLDSYFKKKYNETFINSKFIVLSSTIDPSDVEKSKNYPMVIGFLSKPITKEILESLKGKI
ncbi:response regulator [Flavobacterium dankookense]|uniref:CheY-like chemotaxis protein n=1 Tax=Flavobacterium dankookense TaxID=706186 RepID=A0A4R6QAQ6_9FLAO|nr:response regulator [Flavobacterium dankookense]TDP59270.1 CheY-like chemotaxis protein [Flavobacterium dankookense]